jgi:hypothetical protein
VCVASKGPGGAQANGGIAASQPPVDPALSLASWADAERLFRSRREAIVPVNEPLTLISQVQRSGGTLLNSLLDGHPELHVHPYELHIGHPTKADWPRLDLAADSDAWLELISEPVIAKLFAAGYRKKPDMDQIEGYPTLPFTVVPTLIDHLFRLLCAEQPPDSQRRVIDHYLTAFFNAWIDNQGLRDAGKRWVTAFAPRTAWGESRERFFADYPDGRIIAVLRDPRAWYSSASRFSGRYRELDEAVALWQHGASEIAAAKRVAPESTLVITYEALVEDLERVMRGVAQWLGIAWSPALLVPTFNRLPVIANSSFTMREPGVSSESKERWRGELSADVLERPVMREAIARHSEVRQLADLG